MDFTVGVYFRASVKVRYRVKSVSLKMVPTPAQNSISTYSQCSIIRKKKIANWEIEAVRAPKLRVSDTRSIVERTEVAAAEL